jgi:hypothetical protein
VLYTAAAAEQHLHERDVNIHFLTFFYNLRRRRFRRFQVYAVSPNYYKVGVTILILRLLLP